MTGTVRRRAARLLGHVPGARAAHRWEREQVRARVYAGVRDVTNRWRYGTGAPRFAERLWVDPRRIEHAVVGRSSLRDSARVVFEEFDASERLPIDEDPVLQAMRLRWVDGLPWEHTGEVERMEQAIRQLGVVHGCRTRQDILKRCARLDEIFWTIDRDGRVKPQAEVEPGTFREVGGIGVHLGANGVPIRAANGRHRFAMARILGLRAMPARIGVVHHSALPQLDALRREPAPAPRDERASWPGSEASHRATPSP